MRLRYVILLLVVAVAAGAAGVQYYYHRLRPEAPRYTLGKVERGPITATVATTGTVSAVVTVQVGSQVSGRIKEIHADFNSPVKRGQLIARIDPESFEAKVTQARAQLEAARATVLNQMGLVERARADIASARANEAVARATVVDMDTNVLETKRQLDRRDELLRRDLIAQAEKDSAQAAHDSARAKQEAARAQVAAAREAVRAAEAQHRVTEAQLQSARAQVAEREATLRQAQVDLENTRILAPVNGVVVSRNVDVGQTVAAAFQAPNLFNIAQDLTRMQVNTNVDESDVGKVAVGQRATFTVDAYRGETFSGEVVQIRKAGQVVQNVVTYVVVVSAGNSAGRLLPGMTASVTIQVDRRDRALKVPNASLRFRPADAGEGAVGSIAAPGQAQAQPGGNAGWQDAGQDRLVRDLDLTDKQKQTLAAILQRTRQVTDSLQAQRMPDTERRERIRITRESGWAEFRGVLTPEQRGRYDKLAAGDRPAPAGAIGQVWVLATDGRPRAVPVRLGIGDPRFTEVLDGSLTEGQEVIVGSTEPSSTRATRGSRIRM
jgi:HlyD family secretion protein